MSLRENRKKIQKSIVYIAANYPPPLAMEELLRVFKTLDAQLQLMKLKLGLPPSVVENENDANSRPTDQEKANPVTESAPGVAACTAEEDQYGV
jgi:hypothetical protein